jgi:hypothetical protein
MHACSCRLCDLCHEFQSSLLSSPVCSAVQALHEWLAERDAELASLRSSHEVALREAVSHAVAAVESDTRHRLLQMQTMLESDKRAALVALDEAWKQRSDVHMFSSPVSHRKASPSSLSSAHASQAHVSPDRHSSVAAVDGADTVPLGIPRLGSAVTTANRFAPSRATSRGPSPLLGEFSARSSSSAPHAEPVLLAHSAPSTQPYAPAPAPRSSPPHGPARRHIADKEPHSFRHSVMERLKHSLTPASSFRQAALAADLGTHRAAFVAERVRLSSVTAGVAARDVTTSLSSVRDATIRADAASRKAESGSMLY